MIRWGGLGRQDQHAHAQRTLHAVHSTGFAVGVNPAREGSPKLGTMLSSWARQRTRDQSRMRGEHGE